MKHLKVDDLEIHPFNERVYGPHDDGLAESLESEGQQVPIKVDPQGRILSGGRRWTGAKRLGWDTIEAEIVKPGDEREMKKYVLLANQYRAKKPPAMQVREADAWREMYEAGEVTKEEMADSARAKGRSGRDASTPASQKTYTSPSGLAPRAAGMSPTTYKDASYVLDPDRGEREIDEAKERGEISGSDAGVLKRKIREDREKLERDEAAPGAVGKGARNRLKDRVRERTVSEEQKRAEHAASLLSDAVEDGEAFLGSLRTLLDGDHLSHLDAGAAVDVGSVYIQIRDEIRDLYRRGGEELLPGGGRHGEIAGENVIEVEATG